MQITRNILIVGSEGSAGQAIFDVLNEDSNNNYICIKFPSLCLCFFIYLYSVQIDSSLY